MTIHKSKGLEFPVVAIADLQGIFRNGGGDVLVDREGGLGFQVPDGAARRLPPRLHRRLAQRTRKRENFDGSSSTSAQLMPRNHLSRATSSNIWQNESQYFL